MKLKIYSIILFAFTLSCIQFNACKPNCDSSNPPKGQTRNFSPLDKSILFPYKDFDTIKFIKNNTDTILFFGGQIVTGYNQSLDQDLSCAHADQLQFMQLTFSNTTYGKIGLYESTLSQANDYGTQYSITFKDNTYGSVDADIVASYSDTTHISISGISYKHVYKFNGNTNTNNLFYVPSLGIIKIIYKNDTYERVP